MCLACALKTMATKRPAFPVGDVVATQRVIALCDGDEAKLVELTCVLITRHATGDCGDVCREDQVENESAILNGGRVISSYAFPDGVGEKKTVWVITEADRSVTTILLPEEY